MDATSWYGLFMHFCDSNHEYFRGAKWLYLVAVLNNKACFCKYRGGNFPVAPWLRAWMYLAEASIDSKDCSLRGFKFPKLDFKKKISHPDSDFHYTFQRSWSFSWSPSLWYCWYLLCHTSFTKNAALCQILEGRSEKP